MAQQKNRRNALIAALAVLVVALAVGGTIAWLTANDTLANQFTVGSIGQPSNPVNPDTDEDPDGDKDQDTDGGEVNGYLFETTWKEDDVYELKQGVAQPKNPNVGIASEDSAFVFLYVSNNSLVDALATAPEGANNLKAYAPYFYLEKQWTAVNTGEATEAGVNPLMSDYGNGEGVAAGAGHTDQSAYVNGLFMYTGDEVDKDDPAVLTATGYVGEITDSIYTGELFEDITIPNDLDGKNVDAVLQNGDITVHAFIYAYDEDAADAGRSDGTADQALTEAIAWAKKIANPEDGE